MKTRHLFFISILALSLFSCSAKKNQETTQDMTQLSFNHEQAECMSAIACFEAKGELICLEGAIRDGSMQD